MLRIAEHWYASDLGRQRQGNEDNFFVRAPLFVVADGMGGAQAGEVASEIAVRSFDDDLPNGSLPEALASVIQGANRRIHDKARSDESMHGMGTTTTAAYVDDDEVVIAHVGDSRAYLLRDGDLIRLTKDHSLVGELVARGKLTEEQAEQHPQRSVITRALGPEANVQVDVDIFPAKAGDLFLLCSDGLTSMVHEPKLRPLFEDGDSLETLGKRLIDAANAAGGRDNITVILFRLEAVERHRERGARGGHGRRATRTTTSEYETFEGDAVPRAAPGRHAPRRRQRRRGAALVRGRRHRRGGLPAQRHGRAVGDPPQRRDRGARGAAAAGSPTRRPAAPHRPAPGRDRLPTSPQAPSARPSRPHRDPCHRLPDPGRRLDGHARRLLRRHRPARRPHDRDLPAGCPTTCRSGSSSTALPPARA